MDERLEWLKAQIEAYLKLFSYEGMAIDEEEFERFLRYMEEKFKPRGIFER